MELHVGMFLAEELMCGRGGKSQAPETQWDYKSQQGPSAGPLQSIIGYSVSVIQTHWLLLACKY